MKDDSHEHLAYRIRAALNPVTLFDVVSTYRESEHQWAVKQLARAYNDYDLEFFRDQREGLKRLKINNPTTSRDPRFFLSRAYNFLRRSSGIPPFRSDTFRLAERMWAIARLRQRIPELPLPAYKPSFEREIRSEIEHLPTQKWSRHSEALGLEFSPAKRGPKPKSES